VTQLGTMGLSRSTLARGRVSRFAASFDWPLCATIVVLAGIGLLNLYSALSGRTHQDLFVRQVMWMLVGLVLYVVATLIDYRSWQRFAWIFLGLAIAAIAFVKLGGVSVKGAKRWIGVGAMTVQPSELAKLAVIVAMARLAEEVEAAELPALELALRLLALAVPVVLILVQPDLGSAILVSLIIVSVSLLCAERLWLLVTGIGTALASLPLLWDHMHGYQRDRILCFLDPAADPTGVCWHTEQSILAVGNGRLTGTGYLDGTQNQFRFLPEQWTDFPFSVWAEEWGFLGCVFLMALLLFLILWTIHVALLAKDTFGAVLCVGVGAMLFWHVLVNIAMVLGLAPVVGVTLPLCSYGGSSVITMLVGLGLVSSVSTRRAS
jgi:rod shape determining protein RodA